MIAESKVDPHQHVIGSPLSQSRNQATWTRKEAAKNTKRQRLTARKPPTSMNSGNITVVKRGMPATVPLNNGSSTPTKAAG